MAAEPLIAGIDGCKAGWFCLIEDGTGKISACIFPTIDAFFRAYPTIQIAAIDIPIGLPESGARQCDLQTRKVLAGPRSASVFPVPVRPVVYSATYEVACSLGRQLEGKAISKQTWGILPKIREVDQFLVCEPQYRAVLKEIHPEVSLYVWNGNRPMTYGKSDASGLDERQRLVKRDMPEVFQAMDSAPTFGFQMNDFLDACAALWTARRIRDGGHRTFPPNPEDGTPRMYA